MNTKIRNLVSCVLAVIMLFTVTIPATAEETTTAPMIDVLNIPITSGQVYDLSNHVAASTVFSLTEGTIYIEFESTSSEEFQSLFSISNGTEDNPDRHFHVYVTGEGGLGMELRNTDSEFKYSMETDAILFSGQTNRIAFKADSATKTYKLFANGTVVAELTKDDYKFISNITGLTNISLGGTIREGSVGYPFSGTIVQASLYNTAFGDSELVEMTANELQPLIEKSDIDITEGSYYDLSNEPKADLVKALEEGTIIISYSSSSANEIQSLFSIGNSTSGNENRHFHIYVRNTGELGMELRNKDINFKYTLSRPAAVDGIFHGEPAVNTVAFKADSDSKTYKLYANGVLVGTLSKTFWKFIDDISGVDNLVLGATIREGAVAYDFAGTIENIKIYNEPLSDEYLIATTGESCNGTRIFYSGDGTNSDYYRIPALLTLKSGTVVSSIDARYGGTHDARSNIDIAFSRSTDGGVTWSAPTLPLKFDDYASEPIDWPRDVIGKNIQIDGSASYIDSVLLQDQTTGRLFLFADAYPFGKGFNNSEDGNGFKEINGNKYLKLHWHEDASGEYNYTIRENGIIYNDTTNTATEYSVDGDYRLMQNGQYLTQEQYDVEFSGLNLKEEHNGVYVNMCVFYKDSVFTLLPTNYLVMKYSDDDGVTWSDMNIMGSFRDVSQRMVLFGPGVGTQIKNGAYAGRLLISSYNSVSGEYGYLYSDDHGATWGFINTDLGESGSFAEAQIVEFPDGTLQTYMRTSVGQIGYITSLDGGTTWNATQYIPNLTVADYGTQLSVINYSQTVDGKPVILLSTPTDAEYRRGGKIFVGIVNDTGGTGYDKYNVTWSDGYEVDRADYGFSYSCMAELPDHRIGILYEKYDSWSRDELHLKDVMRYDIFTIEELIAG